MQCLTLSQERLRAREGCHRGGLHSPDHGGLSGPRRADRVGGEHGRRTVHGSGGRDGGVAIAVEQDARLGLVGLGGEQTGQLFGLVLGLQLFLAARRREEDDRRAWLAGCHGQRAGGGAADVGDGAGVSDDVDGGRGNEGAGGHRLGNGLEAHAHALRVLRFVLARTREKLLGLDARQVRRGRLCLQY